ncbi:MAG: Gfo/Idh/MocA family oxidoreductase [Bacteroidales bacterium]|jgi:predicted dehydrogenase|nr:Gfo/Idh/MocA family oxidoreductase [Bacteroidales bacterium]
MKEIRWGIIGCGNVTEKKSGPAFQKATGSNLVAVMRRNEKKVRDYACRHNVPRWYTDGYQLINDKEVDAVYIATPPGTHAYYAISAMRAGKPVYVEKPMALNFKECEEMNRVSRETGIPLFVAYYRRTLPGFLKVKEWIHSGAIGHVRFVRISLTQPFYPEDLEPENQEWWRVVPEIAGGGHFFDLASHQLDYLDFVLGPVSKTEGLAKNQAKKYKAEDIVAAHFVFKNGVIGSGTWCFTADPVAEEDLLEFIGSKGKIIFSTYKVIPPRLITPAGIKTYKYKNPENIQLNLVQSIVDELLEKGKCPSTGVTAARTSRVMGEIVNSYYAKNR